MKEIIFHSLYTDHDLCTLKHAVFYFGKIIIPSAGFMFALPHPEDGFAERPAHADYITLIPEDVYPHLEFLESEGRVERLECNTGESVDPRRLIELIVDEGNRSGRTRLYTPADVAPLFSFLRLNPQHEDATVLADQLAAAVVAMVLEGVALGRGFPCVDNAVIFDLVNFGLKGIFDGFVDSGGFTEEEVASLKAQYLEQAVASLFLPSFPFRSLEEVLDLREHFKDGLAALESQLLEAGSTLRGLPWEAGFQSELAEKIRGEVVPEINELRRAVRFSPKRIARKMVAAGAIVTLNTLVPEFVADWVVGGGAISLLEAVKKERARAQQAYVESSYSVLLQIPR